MHVCTYMYAYWCAPEYAQRNPVSIGVYVCSRTRSLWASTLHHLARCLHANLPYMRIPDIWYTHTHTIPHLEFALMHLSCLQPCIYSMFVNKGHAHACAEKGNLHKISTGWLVHQMQLRRRVLAIHLVLRRGMEVELCRNMNQYAGMTVRTYVPMRILSRDEDMAETRKREPRARIVLYLGREPHARIARIVLYLGLIVHVLTKKLIPSTLVPEEFFATLNLDGVASPLANHLVFEGVLNVLSHILKVGSVHRCQLRVRVLVLILYGVCVLACLFLQKSSVHARKHVVSPNTNTRAQLRTHIMHTRIITHAHRRCTFVFEQWSCTSESLCSNSQCAYS